jgi:hypothetical protein
MIVLPDYFHTIFLFLRQGKENIVNKPFCGIIGRVVRPLFPPIYPIPILRNKAGNTHFILQ